MKRAAGVVLCLLALSGATIARAAEFDEMLGNTCDPGDLRPGLHESWQSYCRGVERQAYNRMQSIAGVASKDTWADCAASIVKPKGSSFIEMVNCLDRALASLPSLPRNSAVLSRGGFAEQRFWTLKECQDAQKAGGGVCIVH